MGLGEALLPVGSGDDGLKHKGDRIGGRDVTPDAPQPPAVLRKRGREGEAIDNERIGGIVDFIEVRVARYDGVPYWF